MILPSRDLRDFAPSRSLAGCGRQRLRAGRVERRTDGVLEAAAAEAMTPQERWSAVDRYMTDQLLESDEALEEALAASAAAGLPPIHVSPNQGKLLQLLARCCGARNILEIGTLAAYSTIWLARALPAEGKLITLEADAKHAEIARANLKRAGMEEKVEWVRGWAV